MVDVDNGDDDVDSSASDSVDNILDSIPHSIPNPSDMGCSTYSSSSRTMSSEGIPT